MFDVTGPLLIVVFIGLCTFLPLRFLITGSSSKLHPEVTAAEATNIAKASDIPEDSTLRRHCLTNYRAEIEAAFAPRPTDSVLKRHHDALIAAELEKRLAEATT